MGDYCRRKAEEAALKKWGDLPCFDDWDRRKMRPMPIGAAPKPPTSRERDLTEALERTRAALRLLQPALNIMARMCVDDIIAREIDAPLAAHQGAGE